MKDLVGQTLSKRYFLREAVGSGGMADVYLAWDKLRSTKMAVKILRRDLAENPRFFQMFANEAELLRKLEHPNIVRLYEFDKEDVLAYIVMDWIDGSNLREAINSRKEPFSLDEVRYVLMPVCSALHYAHQHEVYHCDVKPPNILLHNDGRVLLSDFGVARLATENVGGGTPPYMAPEQFSSGEVSAQSDIYALGITLYELLSGGRIPFRGESSASQGSTTRDRIAWEHSHMQLPSLRAVNSTLPESVEVVIERALSKQPHDRYKTTIELREAFEQAAASGGQPISLVDTFASLFPSKGNQPGHPTTSRQQASQDIASQLQTKFQQFSQTQLPSTSKQFKRLIDSIQLPKVNVPAPSTSKRGSSTGQGVRPYLFGRSGDWQQRMIPIPPQGLTIGRANQNQIRLSENSVSRQHATIIRTRRGIYVRDENSSLGTVVNGHKISGPTKIKHGDVIQIGYYQVFEFRER